MICAGTESCQLLGTASVIADYEFIKSQLNS